MYSCFTPEDRFLSNPAKILKEWKTTLDTWIIIKSKFIRRDFLLSIKRPFFHFTVSMKSFSSMNYYHLNFKHNYLKLMSKTLRFNSFTNNWIHQRILFKIKLIRKFNKMEPVIATAIKCCGGLHKFFGE